MKRIMKKLTALLVVMLMLFATSSQAASYVVHLLNTRSNGVNYTYNGKTIQDYYVGSEKGYSYYCLSGGMQLRDDMISGTTGTYTNKTAWSSFSDKSIFKNNDPEPVKWLVKNMYSETDDTKTNDYMLEHLNNIIKYYAPEGYKDCNVKSIGEKEFIEVIQQMVVWQFVNNKYNTYDNMITSESDIGKIEFGGYTYKGTEGQRIGYALYKALESGAKYRGYSIEEDSDAYTLTLKKGTGFTLENLENNTYVLGPVTLGTTAKNKKLIENVTDSLNISTTGISYLDTNKKDITVKDKKDLIGKTYYIKFTTTNALTDGKSVTYKCDADLGYRISNITANMYTKTDRQPILQLKKTLKNDLSNKFISTEVENPFDIALTKQILGVSRYNKETKQYESVLNYDEGSSLNRLQKVDKSTITANGGTAKYMMDKTPVTVSIGDRVTYRIKVYNEGYSKANIKEITDYLPQGLKYIDMSTSNILKDYITAQANNDKNEVKITINGLGAMSPNSDTSEELNYLYVDIICQVTDEVTEGQEIINYAAVTKYANANGIEANKEGIDRDSEQNDTINFEEYNKRIELYRKWIDQSNIDKGIISQQDDDDFEIIKIGKFDLALRKFISGVTRDGENIDIGASREPTFNISSVAALMSSGTATYNHPKDPVSVKVGDKVTYTIRVYNEGNIDGYAKEIVDYLPSGLEFVEGSEINKGWTATKNEDGTTTVKTSNLANTLLHAGNDGKSISQGFMLNPIDETGTEVEPAFVADVQIECIVKNNQSINLVNVAEISNYGYNKITQDTEGNIVETYIEANKEGVDRDSEDNNVFSKNKNVTNIDEYYNNIIKPQIDSGKSNYTGIQDDDDFEILNVEPFDLSLRKFISGVTRDGEQVDIGASREPIFTINSVATLISSGTATYNHPKNPVAVKVGDKVTYTIRVYNEGYIDGYAKEITDYLPKGLEFVENSEINKGWTATKNEDGTTTVKTSNLANTLLHAGNDGKSIAQGFMLNPIDETGTRVEPPFMADVQIECVVTAEISGNLVNVAEISKYGYESNGEIIYASEETIDRDSEQNNVFNKDTSISDSIKGYYDRIIYDDNILYYPGIQDDDDFEVVNVEILPGKYSLVIEKVDEQGNKLSGVTFGVNGKTTEETGEDGKVSIVSDKDITADTLKTVDTYEITEINTVKGYVSLQDSISVYVTKKIEDSKYVLDKASFEENNEVTTKEVILEDGTKATVTISIEGEVVKVTIPNNPVEEKYGRYSLEIEKIDEKSNKLSGVTFNVNGTETKATGEDGKVNVINNKAITEGTVAKVDTYKINEIKVSDQYISLDEELIVYVSKKEEEKAYTLDKVSFDKEKEVTQKEVQLKDGTKVNVTIKVNGELITVTIPNKKVEQKKGKYSLEIEKIDTDNNKLPGITFNVNGETTKATGEDGKVKVISDKEISKDNFGIVDIYKISEIQVSDEYVSLNEELTVYVSKKEEEKAYTLDKVSFDKEKEVTEKEVQLKDGTIVKVTVKINGDVVVVTIPNKPQVFDLALRKWVTKAIVIENGNETITQTGHKAEDDPEEIVKVEIKRNKLNSVVVKFEYQIRVTNEGKIAGYAREISDYIPEGLKFDPADNPTWKEVSGKVTTDQLKDKLLQPGESAEVTIKLTWINGEDNMGLKINTAEISEDYNEYGIPDIDSTPNNKVPGEDDIDDAPVMLTISTGRVITYFAISITVLTILVLGIVAIKKYVL